ncbi:MAG: tRNA (adenosine(37)-N6)-threonylcarbamoyltransferase complex dimerization subunit type 1 TsaB [Brachymonas sp.]
MKLLAFDTSTEHMSIAVQHGGQVWEHNAAGGAQASSGMIGAIEALMQQAGLTYAQLDAICFGRGPGAFTGLRTACAVAQGLAFGANLPVLPVDTLMIVAQEARLQGAQHRHILSALDARMGEVYANYYEFDSIPRRIDAGELLKKPQNLLDGVPEPLPLIAGNIRPTLDAQLSPQALALPYLQALPTARALLCLAPALIEAGGLTDAANALPLYVRDKVAQTTAERQAASLTNA